VIHLDRYIAASCLAVQANVMLEYTYAEAERLLSENLAAAESKKRVNGEDLLYLRDQIIKAEVRCGVQLLVWCVRGRVGECWQVVRTPRHPRVPLQVSLSRVYNHDVKLRREAKGKAAAEATAASAAGGAGVASS